MLKKTGIILGTIGILIYFIGLWAWNSQIDIPRVLEIASFLSLIIGIIGLVVSIKTKTILGIVLNSISILIILISTLAFIGFRV